MAKQETENLFKNPLVVLVFLISLFLGVAGAVSGNSWLLGGGILIFGGYCVFSYVTNLLNLP